MDARNRPPDYQQGPWPQPDPYGTDDPSEQARIEQARSDAHHDRQRDRAEFERIADLGVNAEDAVSVVELGHHVKRLAVDES